MFLILPIIVCLVGLVFFVVSFFMATATKGRIPRSARIQGKGAVLVTAVTFITALFSSLIGVGIDLLISGGFEPTKTHITNYDKRQIFVEGDKISFMICARDGKFEKKYFYLNNVEERDIAEIEVLETTLEIKNHFLRKAYGEFYKYSKTRLIIPKGILTSH